MSAWYNEIEAFPASRIRERAERGLIASGVVDERDIRDILPTEIDGFTQCHFFAGGGAWSYALRLAGWPDDRPVWTLSCPCQPFSSAGQGAGFADERHLWPSAFHLVDVHRPDVIFGEQVASKDGLNWFDLVRADLEGAGYAVGVQDTCSAGVGAPNIRQRLYFVAERVADARHGSRGVDRKLPSASCPDERAASDKGRDVGARASPHSGPDGRLAGADSGERDGRPDAPGRHDGRGPDAGRAEGHGGPAACGELGGLADPHRRRSSARGLSVRSGRQVEAPAVEQRLGEDGRPGPVNGFWADADWLYCRDERWRPVEPGLEPLVAGASARVGRLREHGNAINVRVAAGFVADYLDGPEPVRLTETSLPTTDVDILELLR